MGPKPVFSFRQMLGHAVRSLCLNSRKDYLFLLVCSQSFLQMIDFCSFPKLGGSAGVVISFLLFVWPKPWTTGCNMERRGHDASRPFIGEKNTSCGDNISNRPQGQQATIQVKFDFDNASKYVIVYATVFSRYGQLK